MESVPVEEGSGAATSASVCSGALSASLANDEGQTYILKKQFCTVYQGLLEEGENEGAGVDLLQEQVEGSNEFVPAGDITFRYRESDSELNTSAIEMNNSKSETSGGPLLFLEDSTDNDDVSSEKEMQLATEKVNLAMQNLDTSTSSLSSQEPSVEKCKDCHFVAHTKYELKQHRIKKHGKTNVPRRKCPRKKISTRRSSNEYSDSYLDEILKDY